MAVVDSTGVVAVSMAAEVDMAVADIANQTSRSAA
jgi:hypothetical protein